MNFTISGPEAIKFIHNLGMHRYLVSLALFLIFPLLALGSVPRIDGIKKISFIYVGPSKGLSESSFGHAALRLSPEETPGILDLVVEFVADIPPNELAIKKYVKGIGIGGKYPMFTGISAFYDFKKLKTIVEDRPLDVYELKLNDEEVQRVIEYINNFKNHITEENYSFFKKNCAYFAILALEIGIRKEIPSKSFPWKSPKRLERLNLVLEKSHYPSGSLERKRYAKKYLDNGLLAAFPKEEWGDYFAENLEEMNLNSRMASYLKILWILQSDLTTSSEKKMANALFRYLVSFEEDSASYVLKSMFKNPELKKVIYSQTLNLNEADLNAVSISHLSSQMIEKKRKISIAVGWIDPRSGQRSRIEFPLSQFYYFEGSDIVTFNNQKIGRFIKIDGERTFLSQKFEYALSYDSSKKLMTLFLYLDLGEGIKSPRKNFDELKTLSHLSLNNTKDFKGEVGSCYAMTLLQKAFLERALFVPDVAVNKDQNKLQILEDLYQGYFVVIPGHSNIYDFTSSINKVDFVEFVRRKQKHLTKNPILQVLENISSREEINHKNFQKIKNLSDEGILLPLIIAMTHKGTKKVATPYAHAVLLLGIEDIGHSSWRLTTYDPNTNVNTLFVLNKDYRLEYPFYDKKFDYVPILDRLSESQIQLDHAVRSRSFNRSKIKDSVSKGHSVIVAPRAISNLLELPH
jgi:hypothetical protein